MCQIIVCDKKARRVFCRLGKQFNKKLKNFADKFDYIANSRVSCEYFPSRNYNGTIFEADYYDALIVNLGSGEGNNWWCVAYPPLCFVGEETGGNVVYKSKLLELINKYFGR